MYAINVYLVYWPWYSRESYLSTGIKNVWIENACPIEAAKGTDPVPNANIGVQQWGAEAMSHIKNNK